jgi:hypothetical protein
LDSTLAAVDTNGGPYSKRDYFSIEEACDQQKSIAFTRDYEHHTFFSHMKISQMDMLPEQLNLGNLPVYWQRVAELDEQADRAMQSWHSMQFTARFLDEVQPAGPRTYIGVIRLLNIAIDNHEAFSH